MSTLLSTQDALLALCRAYNGGATFTSANSASDDRAVLDGGEASLVVLMNGPTAEGEELDGYGGHGAMQERHEFTVWVCVSRFTGEGGDGAAVRSVKALTEALKDHLRRYERLNGAAGVRLARLAETTEPRDADTKQHVCMGITVRVWCENEYEPLEVGG